MSAERLDDLAASFARHLRAEGKAGRTVELYDMAVRLYAAWLVEHDRPPTVDSLTRRSVEAWLADLGARVAPATVRTRSKGLQRFTRWLVAEDEIDRDPMAGLRPPTAPEAPVPVLTDEEIARLLKVCSGKTFRDRRDEAIVRLLLDTGVRISELVGITLASSTRSRRSSPSPAPSGTSSPRGQPRPAGVRPRPRRGWETSSSRSAAGPGSRFTSS